MPDEPADPSPALQRSIWLLSSATFASMSAQRVCDAMLPALADEFSVSLAQAAQVVSAFAVVYGAAQLLYGPLGDRLGKFAVVTCSTLACVLGTVVSALARDLHVLTLGRMLVAVAAAAIIPMSLAWVGDAVPYERRQVMLARLGFGSMLGLVGGQLVGGLFTDWVGWRWAFVALTLMFGAVGVLLWRDWQYQRRHPHLLAGGALAGQRPGLMTLLPAILRRPHARVVMTVALLEGALAYGVFAIWASHLHLQAGLSLAAAGATAATFGLGGVAYVLLARRLVPRLGERGLALAGSVLLALGAFGVAFAPHWAVAPPACLVAGFGLGMLHNTLQTHGTQIAPEARGMGMSLFAASLFMGQALGVLLAASLSERLGSGVTIASAGLGLVGVALYFRRVLHGRSEGAAGR